MSMLLGVRGSSRETEGQPVRESIIQQPGRFYSGQQTSSIWSSPPTPPPWRDPSSANASITSSSATSESSVFSSFSSSRSSGMEQPQQWQQRFVFQAGGDGPRIDKQKNNDASSSKISTQPRSDAAGSSTFVFGFPSQSTSSVNSQVLHASCPFQAANRSSGQNPAPCGGGSHESQGSQMPSSDAEVEDLRRDWEARLCLQSGHTSHPCIPSASPYAFTANDIRQSTGKSASNPGAAVNLASMSAGKSSFNPVAGTALLSATQSISEMRDKAIVDPPNLSSNDAKSSSQSDSPKVFVFGASGVSGINARTGASQQKTSNFPTVGSFSKRGKIKKQNSSFKGKGPTVVGGVGFGQRIPDYSRESSPLPSPRVDAGGILNPDDAECSHVPGHVRGDTDTSEYGSSKLGETEGMHHFYWAEANLAFGFDPEHSQKMEEQFDSWDPFLPNSEEASKKISDQARVEDCVGLASEEAIAKLMTELKQFGSPLGKDGGSGGVTDRVFGQEGRVKVFPGGEAVFDRFKDSKVPLESQRSKDKSVEESRCRVEMLGRSGTPVDRQKENQDFIEELRRRIEKLGSSNTPMDEQKEYQESIEVLQSRIEKLGKSDMPRDRQKENEEFVSDGGGKDGAYPFVFRASKPLKLSSSPLQTVSESGSKAFNESGASLPSLSTRKGSVDMDERGKEFLGVEGINCRDPVQSSRFSWSAASSGVQSDTAINKGPFGAHFEQFPSSSNSFVRVPYSVSSEMQESYSMKSRSEGPVGEFAGPPSSSESSLSDSSPARSEDGSAPDGLSYGSSQFKFQGCSEGVHIGVSTEKKKARVSSAIRKQSRRPTHRQKKSSGSQGGLYTTPVKESTGSPMDFSPCTGDTAPFLSTGFKEAHREEPFYCATPKEDSKEAWASSSETQLNIENLRAAAARLNIAKDSSNDNDIWVGSDSSFQRSAKSKRSSIEEVVNASTQVENLWDTPQTRRTDDAERDNVMGTSHNSGSGAFVFGGNNSQFSSAAPRHAWRTQGESQAEIGRYPIAHGGLNTILNTTGAVVPGTAGLGRVVETKMQPSQGLSHEKQAVAKASNLGPSSSAHHDSAMPASPNTVKSAAAEQVCERWRLRGNKAYANGDFPKAEEYYSRGASSVSPNETSQSCIRASMLCYSNRAATRMAVGRMREALADCMRAMVVDPNFVRVRLRAASCYLALGESDSAGNMFRECLKQAKEGNKPDPKIAADAVDGIKKTQQLEDYTERASELLQKENASDYTAVLRLLNEALLISPYSELLLEMKSRVFFSLRRFEEVVQLCEQSLVSAERNHGFIVSEQQPQDFGVGEPLLGNENIALKLWRWRMSAKSLFHLGKLEESLELLTKHEEALSAMAPDKAVSIESLAPLVSCITDLLRHKAAGNEAFQAGKHVEAVEYYTAALACNGESRPYNAVCFCNRAAASQSLGHIADAIADCSRAIALDPNYPKAISRRATLHEMVRDFGQACNDLQRLVTLLEGYQSTWKNSPSSRTGSQNGNAQDLRQARDRLAKAEDEMKRGYPINHYLILGVESSCSANEIKKAYRKAALKHHPDKAGQFLVRSDNGDDGALWKEVGDEVRRDAERLFKLIGEAYAILSDPTKRLRYDTEEEHRKLRAKGSVSVSGTPDGYRSQYEKSSRRQHDRYTWNGYAPQYQRWQSAPDAAQPDTYARKSTYAANGSRTGGNTSRYSDYAFDDI